MRSTHLSSRKSTTGADEFRSSCYTGVIRPDPAMIVAETMLHRALDSHPARGEAVIPALTVVRTPSADWTLSIAEAWGEMVQGGIQCADGDDTRHWVHEEEWVCFVRPDAASQPSSRVVKEQSEDAVARALSNDVPVVGFAPDDALLPRYLVYDADFHLSIGAPSPEDIAQAVGRLTGGAPTIPLVKQEAAAMTPRLVRLACRPAQTPNDYVVRLRDLLGQQLAAQATARRVAPREAPTLERPHGMDEAVAWGRSIQTALKAYAAGELPWSDVDSAVLLSGPPGTGKTLYARALAGSCGVPLVTGSYAHWSGSGTGSQADLLRAVRKTFADAKAQGPGILLLNDVDSLPGRDAVTHRHADRDPQVVSVLIAELDDAEGREGIVVIAASNHPGKLDPALLRSGRLDRHIRIRLPKAPALALILREHLGDELGDVSLSVPPCMPLVRPVPIVSVSSEVHGGGHERRDV